MDPLKYFSQLGTRFFKQPDVLRRRLANVRCILLDWDGVFNDGFKDQNGSSPFSEVDSMGLNLLRFSFWSMNRQLPPCAIITGQHNALAQAFAERENLHGVYMGFTNKTEALALFLKEHGLRAEQVAFFFDDVLDLPIARQCAFSSLIRRSASPLMEIAAYKGNGDIATFNSGATHGLREACELIMYLTGRWEETLEHRVSYSGTYQNYLQTRNAVVAQVVHNER
jgi:3-deoxy-D-manno-octulosonate 8-phosphate phosphatase (KDO 8-P phosphatase)